MIGEKIIDCLYLLGMVILSIIGVIMVLIYIILCIIIAAILVLFALSLIMCLSQIPNPLGPSPDMSLSITSQPSGASIYIDGNYEGITPKNIRITDFNEHNLRLQLDGYLIHDEIIRFYQGEQDEIERNIKLNPLIYLTVISQPPGASIYIDESYAGITPNYILIKNFGEHTLRLELDGYIPYEETITFTQEVDYIKKNIQLAIKPVKVREYPLSEENTWIKSLTTDDATYLVSNQTVNSMSSNEIVENTSIIKSTDEEPKTLENISFLNQEQGITKNNIEESKKIFGFESIMGFVGMFCAYIFMRLKGDYQ